MLSNKTEMYANYIPSRMTCLFGGTTILAESVSDLTHGWFRIRFNYLPSHMGIQFEAEYGVFTVRLEQEDGTFTFLNRIKPFDNCLSIENLNNAINLLKEEINHPIIFYKATADGLFRKEGTNYIRLSYEEMRALYSGKKETTS